MAISDDKFANASPSQAFYDLAMADEETLDEVEDHPPPSPEFPGLVIAGRYILKAVLGEGGTGQVWCAEQTEPVRREVAIKIIRPGLLTKPVSARFNREHQVLARMEHPNIAAVFDAGELPDGRTYFAMEVVAGAAITRWCKKHEVPVKERLEIFLQACMAVHHAHQKGILHRDLKPSNMMVTQVDGKPVVKVIDFGIAKALEGDLSLGQEVTLRGTVLGTPRYMSPEQAGLTGQEVDARTDVYALGVLLYELLTGTTPIPNDEANEPSLPELLQRVRQTETEMPSRRVTRMSSVSGDQSQVRSLSRALRGELDWILLRALQKEREHRYATVQALAEDVQRYLRDEPVSAGPPGTGYRAKKWLVRHRSAIVTAGAVLMSLAGGLAATWWALTREEVQRQEALLSKRIALSESDLAKQVNAQLKDLLSNARKHAQAGMNTQILRNLADECAAGMERFAHQPKTEAQLAHQLGQLYYALEESERALPWFERRWTLLKQTEGEHSVAALEALYSLAWRSIGHGDPQRAVDLLRQTAESYESLPDAAVNGGIRAQVLLARKEMARALSRAGRHEEAVALIAETIQAKGEADPVQAANWLRDQCDILRASGRLDEAAAVLHHALDLLPKDEVHASQRAYLLSTLANVRRDDASYTQALEASAERLLLLEKQYSSGHPRLISALLEHAALACKVPDCPGGEEAARSALAMARAAGHESRLADAWITVSETLRMKHQYRESEQAMRDAIAEISATKAEKWRVLEMHRRLGDLRTARSDFKEALREYEIAAEGWFDKSITSRPREKEELIFGSIIKFWELVEKANSPLAD